MKYIAYGSNMVIEDMKVRCPDSVLLGTGYLHGASMEFYYMATLIHSFNHNEKVPVALWEISKEDEKRLDAYEEYPDFYIKVNRTCTLLDGREMEGMVYLMRRFEFLPPPDYYYDSIAGAYRDLGFEELVNTVMVPAKERSMLRCQRGIQHG